MLPPRWEQGWEHQERYIILPIEIEGESTDCKRHVASLIDFEGEQFRIGLMTPFCIARLDFTQETHSNTVMIAEDHIPILVRGPHYHSWALNRRFFRSVTEAPRLRNASPFTAHHRSFDDILRWFLGEHGIESLPANHAVCLPQRDWPF